MPVTMRAAYDATRRGGTACIVGVGSWTSSSASRPSSSSSTRRPSSARTTAPPTCAPTSTLLGFWKAGKLDLEGMITRRIKIDDINDAFGAMERGEVIRQVISF